MDDVDRRIVTLLAKGMTTFEISVLLELPVDEVRRRVDAAVRASGARSRLGMVLDAIRRDLIRP